MKHIDSIIMACVGLFATLQGFEVICFAKKPDASDTQKVKKWQQTQRIYRWAGPVAFICGLLLWFLS
jgi:hypothetical protein